MENVWERWDLSRIVRKWIGRFFPSRPIETVTRRKWIGGEKKSTAVSRPRSSWIFFPPVMYVCFFYNVHCTCSLPVKITRQDTKRKLLVYIFVSMILPVFQAIHRQVPSTTTPLKKMTFPGPSIIPIRSADRVNSIWLNPTKSGRKKIIQYDLTSQN